MRRGPSPIKLLILRHKPAGHRPRKPLGSPFSGSFCALLPDRAQPAGLRD